MRFAFLISGIFGFFLVAALGFSAERAPDLVLRDAAIGCLVAAIVGRWFWRGLDKAFAQALAVRRAEEEAAEAAAEAREAAAAAAAKTSKLASPLPTSAAASPAAAPAPRPALAKR